MSQLSLHDYATDFVVQAQKVAGIADEVAEGVAKDDLDGAVLVLGVSQGKLAELTDGMHEMQRQLQKVGADWKRALGREDDHES